jgi:hypothetical protein
VPPILALPPVEVMPLMQELEMVGDGRG